MVFYYGGAGWVYKTYDYSVRCVCEGPGVFGTLTLQKTGTGTGKVTSDPAGIECGTDCAQQKEKYQAGTAITLEAEPDEDSVFTGWSGGGCEGTGDCVVDMTRYFITVTANFEIKTYNVSGTVKTPDGSPFPGVTITLTGTSTATTSTDSAGEYAFSKLLKGVYTLSPSKSHYMFSPVRRTLNVNDADLKGQDFVGIASRTLSVDKAGHGSGRITATPAGIDCGQDCSGDYPLGTEVTLSAKPNVYSLFAGWSGGGCSDTADCTVAMNEDLFVTANFAWKTYTISGVITNGAGLKLPGVTISVAERPAGATATDDNGFYALSGLFPGAYTLTPTKTQYKFIPSTAKVIVTGSDVTNQGFKGEVSPRAGFSADPTGGYYSLPVQFKNESTGDIKSFSWKFGDGSSSTEQDPVHTYKKPGAYTVTLKAIGFLFSDTTIKKNHIRVLNHKPTARITKPTNGAAFWGPANIAILADAGDEDGTVKQVGFYANGVELGVDAESPYGFDWEDVPVGTYSLTAKTTDNFGATRISAPVKIVVKPNADLSVVMTDSPDPVKVNDLLFYSLTVANNGPDRASGVVATDALPAGVTYVSVISSQGNCNKSGSTITCNLGEMDKGESATIDLVVKAVAAGVVSNTASVKGTPGDPNTKNNKATVKTSVVK